MLCNFSFRIEAVCIHLHHFIKLARATLQEPLSDEEVVTPVLAGETGMFEIIMHRYNRRLHHVARAILRNDGKPGRDQHSVSRGRLQ